MSAEEQKPVVAAETPVVEPAVAEPAVATETAPAVEEPKTEEVRAEEPVAAAPAEGAAAEELPKEEKVGKDEVAITAEPIFSGALGYKAPGLVKSLMYSKKYFWFGEEEPIAHSNLSNYLRGEKAEVAHPTAAWSSKTGKGLLYFVKHADQKATPAGVLNLAEATDVAKEGTVAFSFKLHGHKHSFEASSQAERDGWVVAVEKTVEEAKAHKETVTGSDEYKESLEKLGKPAAVGAASTGKTESAPKKSTELKPTDDAARQNSSSSEEGAKKESKGKKSKSRSVSRKRQSLFGGLLGKKEEHDVKKDEKKEEKAEEKEAKEEAKEEKAEEEAAKAEGTAAPLEAETVASRAIDAPVEEATPAEGEAAVVPPVETAEEKNTMEKPKPAKRASLFGNFFEKVRSPASEKKESEVAPVVPPKDGEAVAAEPLVTDSTAPAISAAVGEPVVPAAEEPKVEEPNKEKKGFFGKFNKEPKSPSAESPLAAEEAPVAAPVEGEAAATNGAAVATPETKQEKRKSFFGNFGKKSEGETEGESKPSKLGGLFRNPSKAVKGNKEKKEANAPAKVDETTEPTEESKEAAPETAAATEAPAAEEVKAVEEPQQLDMPESAVGQASQTPAVHAAA
ncbi:hypothetical protein K490DRAFT_72753 [Saccharata proteae CBS 121410]|uniref:Meiotic expression up-regulated protein 6 PH domain-containing protein n=1 Tax=Saccharata proteae CBS 121410 TaxID=1314787 RepID=A0A6A5YCC6_9PEZI|nr:hypothetical protein K490DRAFT_72753 [Saccharata proteae CBS 121410]